MTETESNAKGSTLMARRDISVQLYTVRDALEDSVSGALGRLAELGFTQVELFDFVRRGDELAEGLSQHHLTAPSGHAMLIGQNPGPTFDVAQELGVRTVIQPSSEQAVWVDADAIAGLAAELNEIAERARERGLTVGYHNHWWEFEHSFEGRYAFEVFADLLHESIVLEVDTYWVQTAGAPVAEVLRRLGGRVKYLHLKDGPATLVMTDQVALGAGTLNVPEILAATPHAVRVLELDDCASDVFQALNEGLAYLEQVDQ